MKMIKEFSLKNNGDLDVIANGNFKVKEFACKDGSDKILINTDLVDCLQGVRNITGNPIKIVSGYRTEDYNNKCGGAKSSKHLTGNAIDFTSRDIAYTNKIFEIALILEYHYLIKGIGIYINREQQFIHFDNREQKIIWINDGIYHTQTYYNNIYDYFVKNQPLKQIKI